MQSLCERLAPGQLAYAKVRQQEPGRWVLDWLTVPPSYRGRGIAGRLLRTLCEQADSEGVTLVLEARACAGVAQRDLEAFYRRHGFVSQGRAGAVGGLVMVRHPAGPARRTA